MDWIQLAHGCVHWRVLVNMVTNIRENCLTNEILSSAPWSQFSYPATIITARAVIFA